MAKSRTTVYFMLALIVLSVIGWLGLFNQYHVLYHHEQMQLFRFNWFYLHTYLINPGGIARYAGAFLTQFYFYPWIGATILALLLAAIYLLFNSICRHNGTTVSVFAWLFIPVFLWMMALVNQHFRLSLLVGFAVALVGFRIYITTKKPLQYISGFVLLLLIYVIAAGNAILFLALVWIFEWFADKQKRLKMFLYLAALTGCALIIPWLAYRFVYTVMPHEAFFALTPADLLFKDFVNISCWLSVPVLYACWRWAAGNVQRWKPVGWKMIVSCILITGVNFGCMVYATDRKAETISGMAFNVQNNRWTKTIQLGASYPFSNSLVSYFTNIAVAESGMLPYRMFNYDQTDATGLFLPWQQTSFVFSNIGEVYYRLGLIREAEHCAFEAMISNSDEHNSQAIRRLVTTSIILRDTALFNKYIRLFDHTLFYRQWANLQRQHMAAALADPEYRLPGAPSYADCDNFFINLNYGKPDFILTNLLEKNPDHRLAFEYMMAWYMIIKDIDKAKACMDTYFHRFPYPDIPVHFEEVLMIYQSINPETNIGEQYPVSSQTRERYNNYLQAYQLAQSNRQMLTKLYQQYGNTYWFFVHFKHSELLQTTADDSERY